MVGNFVKIISRFSVLSTVVFFTAASAVLAHPVFYVNAGLGQASYDSSTDDDPRFVGSVDESATSWMLGGGVNVNEYLTVEMGYVDIGELKYNGLYLGTPDYGTVETTGWEATVIGKYPINQQFNINLIAKVGLFFWESDEEEIFNGTPLVGMSQDGEDPVFGLGIQGRVQRSYDLRLEWNRYTNVADDDIDVILLRSIYSF